MEVVEDDEQPGPTGVAGRLPKGAGDGVVRGEGSLGDPVVVVGPALVLVGELWRHGDVEPGEGCRQGHRGGAPSSAEQLPNAAVMPRLAASVIVQSTRRDLPAPASPTMRRAPGRPSRASVSSLAMASRSR